MAFGISCVVFVFGMAAFFCFMVLRHTRKLFSPEEIRPEFIGRSIFSESDETTQEKMEEIRKKVEAKAASDIENLMQDVSDRVARLMAHAGTNEPTIKQLRPEIEVLVRETVANTRSVELEKRAEESARMAYVSAMQSIRGFFTCVDITAGGAGMSEDLKEVKKRLMVAASLLQIEFGNSQEVITGANNVYQLAPVAARSVLAKGLTRQDLTPEARETLQVRLRELVKPGVPETGAAEAT